MTTLLSPVPLANLILSDVESIERHTAAVNRERALHSPDAVELREVAPAETTDAVEVASEDLDWWPTQTDADWQDEYRWELGPDDDAIADDDVRTDADWEEMHLAGRDDYRL